MIRAEMWSPTDGGAVRCHLCFRACRIEDGRAGFCAVRVNQKSVLYTFVADHAVSVSLDPVEKKPLFHFLPGTKTLSIGTYGCNFSCLFCQNHAISRGPADTGRLSRAFPVRPPQILSAALANGAPSVSFTYNEPTVFYELLRPTARLCIEAGLKTVMVTNGGMSLSCLNGLQGLVSAANVDLKSFRPEFYRDVCSGNLEVVKANLCRLREMGVWLEVTTLIIPGLNDGDEELRRIADFIRSELGADVPWHISAFFPTYRMQDRPPTPVSTLSRAWHIGRDEGLSFVYAGNLRIEGLETTYCPSCHAPLIERRGYTLCNEPSFVCKTCGTILSGIWS